MAKKIRIGTRDSQLAVWQATHVQELLAANGVDSELIYIKSEGDIDTVTPLYALGVQGVFTKTLDAALLNNRIDIAVHSMKDVPTQLAKGIIESAVLERASYKDIFVFKGSPDFLNDPSSQATIGTSSIRRIAQWKNRFPNHKVENLRGNVNTRLRKVAESNWNGAIFAAAGLDRIHLRPAESVELDWMLPAPAQGAIMIVCRGDDPYSYDATHALNHPVTALCTRIERDFLKTLMGGCSTPISGLAQMQYAQIIFNGSICSVDGSEMKTVKRVLDINDASDLGVIAAHEILEKGGDRLVEKIRKTGLSTEEDA